MKLRLFAKVFCIGYRLSLVLSTTLHTSLSPLALSVFSALIVICVVPTSPLLNGEQAPSLHLSLPVSHSEFQSYRNSWLIKFGLIRCHGMKVNTITIDQTVICIVIFWCSGVWLVIPSKWIDLENYNSLNGFAIE